MELIADIFLIAGALGAALYCFVLGRRLKKFNNLEQGVGGAVAVLSSQVDGLNKTLATAQATAKESANTLLDLSTRAEDASKRLELQMAALHDIPQTEVAPTATIEPNNRNVPEYTGSEPMFVRHRIGGGKRQ